MQLGDIYFFAGPCLCFHDVLWWWRADMDTAAGLERGDRRRGREVWGNRADFWVAAHALVSPEHRTSSGGRTRRADRSRARTHSCSWRGAPSHARVRVACVAAVPLLPCPLPSPPLLLVAVSVRVVTQFNYDNAFSRKSCNEQVMLRSCHDRFVHK